MTYLVFTPTTLGCCVDYYSILGCCVDYYSMCLSVCLQILAALELSQSTQVLELVISILCRERRHAHHDRIQHVLARYVKR